MYTHSSTAVPYGRGGAREPVLNLVPGHDGHGHIYGHGYGHFLKEITKVVSGQWSVRARTWALRSVGQRLWSVYPRFCYCGQGQWSEVRETDRTALQFCGIDQIYRGHKIGSFDPLIKNSSATDSR